MARVAVEQPHKPKADPPKDPPKEPPKDPPKDDDDKASLAAFEKRIKSLENKPAPWWHYAIVLAIAIFIIFGERTVSVLKSRITEATRARR